MRNQQTKFLTLIFLALSFNLYSQRITGYVSADTLIDRGIRYHDDESYQSAIGEYSKVHRSDAKYPLALYEIALSYSKLKEYDSVLVYLNKSMANNKKYLLEDAFILKGAALDNLKKFELARENYYEGLKIFPKNIRILHHIGISYFLQDSIQKALDIFKDVNVKYSGYVKNQLVIAELAEKEGKLTQAFLAYCNALLYSLGSDRGQDILADMDKLASKKYSDNPSGIIFSESGDNFDEIDALLKSKVALQSKYKINTEIDFPVVRQLHLLFSQLENYEPTTGYFDKYYVPFYKKLMKENYFPEMIGLMTMTVKNAKIKSLFKKNESNILECIKWTQTELPLSINRRDIEVNGKTVNLPCVFSDGEKRCGEVNDGKANGMWYYYYRNGNLQYFGENKDGESEGLWTYYYPSGNLKSEINFAKNVKNGTYKKYYENGKLKEKGAFVNDSLDGEITFYYEFGNIYMQGKAVDNKQEGEWKEYYRSGRIKRTFNYKEDYYHGEYIAYAEDGKTVLRKLNYKEGKYDGEQKSFYNNGVLELVSNYDNGIKTGEFKEYFLDGKIRESGKYENNTITDHKLYFANEKLNKVYEYNKDEIVGIENRDYDGQPFTKAIYKNDLIKQVKYFDADGNEISKESYSKNDDYVSKWFYSGNKNTTGEFKKGKKQGKWEYYHINGSIDQIEHLDKGVTNGLQETYNNQGQLIKSYEMKDGENHGFWRKHDESGVIISEGWFENGNKVGPWYEYYSDGTLKREYYFKDNNINGLYFEYDPDGKLDEVYHYEDGSLLSIDYYDTNGKIVSSMDLNQEKIDIKQNSKFAYNGQKRNRVFGNIEGEVYLEPIAGVYDYYGNYLANENHGLFTYNFKNGAKYRSSNFFLGEKNGTDTIFYINGNIYSTQEHNQGVGYGKFNRYYYNGAKYYDYTQIADEKDGYENYFSLTGELFLQKFYKLGYLDYIVQNNASGELTDTIKVKNETIDIECKYKNGQIAFKEKLILDELIDYKLYDDKGILLYNIESDKNGQMSKKETFYANGKMMSSESFTNGEANGEEKIMREDGTIILQQDFKLGTYHGNVKMYDSAGQLINHLIYRNGRAYEKIQ